MPPNWVEELVDVFTDDSSCLAVCCEFVSPEQFPFECAEKTLGDRLVDGLDLIAVLVVWGTTGDGLPADFNRSGIVDGGDLSFVTSGWGACAD